VGGNVEKAALASSSSNRKEVLVGTALALWEDKILSWNSVNYFFSQFEYKPETGKNQLCHSRNNNKL
jgi:hypothetical protein